MTSFTEQTAKIMEAMEQGSGARAGSLDEHPANRLAALLGDAEIVFLDADSPSGATSDGTFVGRVVAMTADHAAVMDADSADESKVPARRVSARLWARRTLDRIDMQGEDMAWGGADERGPIPTGCHVELHYSTGDQMVIPQNVALPTTRRAVAALLPSLQDDVALP
jgi:hypothetical protein